jgi:hypothetical protein
MVRAHLSQQLKDAGRELLATTDALGMQAQGAMWLYSHALQDWRYYLVTSLVDTIGRRKTYGLLLDAFERIDLPKEMTVEDVHLGSPNDPLFQIVSGGLGVGNAQVEVHNCSFDGLQFDGVIYRSVRKLPAAREAEQIQKRFAKSVRNLGSHPRKGRAAKIERIIS